MSGMVEVDGLSKSFGDFQAVNNVSFTVAQGEVLGFLGPNGAGKTTTLKLLSGVINPTQGTPKPLSLANKCGNS